MAIITLENSYQGVNAHLNSMLQTPGNVEAGPSIWPGFHASHINDLMNFLNDHLPTHYVARTEQSLQIKVQNDATADVKVLRPEPDVTIYQQAGAQPVSTMATMTRAVPLDIPLDGTLDLTEDFVKAIVIRQVNEGVRSGVVVTRIELLSPSNKPGHTGYDAYRRNRNEALYSHIPLIEIDYLHETPPPMLNYPVYPDDDGSHPYHIFVNDPRPAVNIGHLWAYGFNVDQPFPIVEIPLAGQETLSFDLGEVYQHTFGRGRWGQMVDYEQSPDRLHTYSGEDRARITVLMQQMQEENATN